MRKCAGRHWLREHTRVPISHTMDEREPKKMSQPQERTWYTVLLVIQRAATYAPHTNYMERLYRDVPYSRRTTQDTILWLEREGMVQRTVGTKRRYIEMTEFGSKMAEVITARNEVFDRRNAYDGKTN